MKSKKIIFGSLILLAIFFLSYNFSLAAGCCIKNIYISCTSNCTNVNSAAECSGAFMNYNDCSSVSAYCSGEECDPSPSANSATFVNPLKHDTVEKVVTSVLNSLKNIVAVLAVLFIVIGGLMYIFSAGDEKRIEMAKKIWTCAVIGFAIVLIAPSLLQEIGKALGWTDTTGTTTGALSLYQIATNILNFLLSIAGIVAIIFLVVGGLTYITAYGEEKRIETGKKIITYAVIGIALIMGALVIVKQVSKLFE